MYFRNNTIRAGRPSDGLKRGTESTGSPAGVCFKLAATYEAPGRLARVRCIRLPSSSARVGGLLDSGGMS